MKTRRLRDLEVSAIGMGCMGFSTAYGQIPSEEESIRLMRKAHDMGCTFYDTAEIYATCRNEELVGKALRPIRKPIIDLVKRYAKEKQCTPAQISLAWVMKQEFIVPIPGMRSDARITENLGATEVILTDEEYAALTAELDKLKVYGERTDEQIAQLSDLRTKLYGASGVHIQP